jgi:uncharacterized membrane protein YdbT with pleckstrin-like domain
MNYEDLSTWQGHPSQLKEDEELSIWTGHPSHLKDAGFHILCGILSPLIVPIGFMLWRYLDTQFHRYDITSERLRVTEGILSKRMKEMEFYRVRETSIHQPFLLRVFRLANIVITVAGPAKREFVIHAVPRAMELRESLRCCIETVRDKKHAQVVSEV